MFDRSAGWAHRIVNDKTYPFSKDSLAYIEALLPEPLWKTSEDLDNLVLFFLKRFCPLTGSELAKKCGAHGRTIRASIKRLRDAGHKIGASMIPPRGYLLEEK